MIFKNSLASSKSRISIQFPSEMFSSSTKGLKYHRAAVCSPRYDISRIRILDKRCIVINTTLLHIHHAFRDRIPNLRIGIQNATYSILAAVVSGSWYLHHDNSLPVLHQLCMCVYVLKCARVCTSYMYIYYIFIYEYIYMYSFIHTLSLFSFSFVCLILSLLPHISVSFIFHFLSSFMIYEYIYS